MDRRGTMYDPLIVDTFLQVYTDIAPDIAEEGEPDHGLSAITRDFGVEPRETATGLDDIAAGTEEMLMLFDLARSLSGQRSFSDSADTIAQHLRRFVPASTCVFYTHDVAVDDLVVSHASGEHSDHFEGAGVFSVGSDSRGGWRPTDRPF